MKQKLWFPRGTEKLVYELGHYKVYKTGFLSLSYVTVYGDFSVIYKGLKDNCIKAATKAEEQIQTKGKDLDIFINDNEQLQSNTNTLHDDLKKDTMTHSSSIMNSDTINKGDLVNYNHGYYTYGSSVDEYGDREVIDVHEEMYGKVLQISGERALCLFYNFADNEHVRAGKIFLDELHVDWINTNKLNKVDTIIDKFQIIDKTDLIEVISIGTAIPHGENFLLKIDTNPILLKINAKPTKQLNNEIIEAVLVYNTESNQHEIVVSDGPLPNNFINSEAISLKIKTKILIEIANNKDYSILDATLIRNNKEKFPNCKNDYSIYEITHKHQPQAIGVGNICEGISITENLNQDTDIFEETIQDTTISKYHPTDLNFDL